MSSIDERIVEMQFRNSQFESGVKTTLDSLARLENALQINTGGLNESVRGIAENLETVKSRFGAFGAIGFSALNTLTNAAIGAGKSMASALIDPLVEGGKKRALNIAQAKFQFEGLGMDIEATMADALYAVKDTAFGLDEAAVAASNFGATGMTAGTEMRNALRGISGVAAMAGASYTDVANIFGKVAGQGRLMGDDLNRLAARGINAAATLAKQMGITEGEVRDMVTKGKISFADFSAAMNVAFGDQATKANQLFTGAMSNVRAALSRIGADFAAPKFEAQRRMLVALIPIIDKVRAALKPLVAVYSELVDRMAGRVEKFFGNQIGVFANFMASLQKWVQGFANIYIAIRSFLAPIGAAFAQVFTPKNIPFTEWANAFARFTERLRAGSETADKIKRAFAGFFTIFKIGLDIFFAATKIVITFFAALFGKSDMVGDLGGSILGLVAKVGDLIVKFRDWLHEGDRFNKAISAVQSGVRTAIEVFRDFGSRLGDVWKAIRAGDWGAFKDAMSSAMSVFDPFKAKLAGLGQMALTALGDVARSVGDWFKGFDLGLFDFLGETFDKLAEKLGLVKENIDGAKPKLDLSGLKEGKIKLPKISIDTGSIKEAISTFWNEIFNSFKNIPTGLKDVFSRAFDFVGQSILGVVEFIKTRGSGELLAIINTIFFMILNKRFKEALDSFRGISESFKGLMGAIGEPFTQLSANLKAFQQSTRANVLIKIAAAILILAAALWVLAKIPADDLKRAVGVMAGLAIGLALMMKVLDTLDLEGKGFAFVGFGIALIAIGAALLVFAAAVKKFGEMDTDVLQQGITAIGVIIAGLIAFTALGNIASMTISGAISLGLLAVVLWGLYYVIEKYATFDWDKTKEGLTGIGVALGLLVLALNLVPPDAISRSLGIIAVVGALWLLTDVLDRLSQIGNKTESLVTLGLALAGIVAALILASNPGVLAGGVALIFAAGALWIMADAITRLSEVDPQALGVALLGLLAAIGLLTIAAAVGAAFWPGFAVLAGFLIALGIAAAGVGWGIKLAADGIANFMTAVSSVENARGAAEALDVFAEAAKKNTDAILPMMGVGLGLIIFAVGLAAMGAAGLLAGVGLIAAALGLALFTRYGEAGAEAIKEFVAQFGLLDMGKIAALGTAFALLGTGLAAVGIGAALTGAGMIVLTGGLAGFLVVASMAIPVMHLLAPAIEKLNGQMGNFKNIGTTVQSAGTQIAGATGNLDGFYGAVSRMGDVLGHTKGQIDGFKSSISSFAMSASLGFSSSALAAEGWATRFKAPFDTTKTNVETASKNISKAISDMSSKIKTELENAANSAKSGGDKIVAAIRSLETRIKSTLSGMTASVGASARNVGVAIGNGMVAGINSQSGRVSAAAASMASRAVSAARANLKIASPSKIFEQIGAFVAEGFATGIDENSYLSSRSSSNMAAIAIQAATDILGISSPSKVFEQLGQYVNEGFANGIRGSNGEVVSAFSGISTAIKTIRSDAKLTVKELQALTSAAEAQHRKDKEALKKAQKAYSEYRTEVNATNLALAQTKHEESHKALVDYMEQLSRATSELREIDDVTYKLTKTQDKHIAKMKQLNREREEIVAKLAAERQAIKDTDEEYAKFYNNIKDKYDDLSDVSGEDTTLGTYLQEMEKKILQTSAFNDVLDKLVKLGINDDLYEELVNKGVSSMPFALSLLNAGGEGIAAVNELGSKLVKVSERIGESATDQLYLVGAELANGVIQGLLDQQRNLDRAIETLANSTVSTFKKTLGISSPSKVFAKLGKSTAQGFSEGLGGYQSAINKSAESMGSEAINALRKSISGMSGLIDGDLDINPTITPVLDLSAVEKDVKQIRNMFGHERINTRLAYDNASDVARSRRRTWRDDIDPSQISTEPAPTLSYVQNNYSPKALSRGEIYRQTRNQLSTVKEALEI